ncbi:telo2 interacting protein 1 [Aphomia sociella]
MNADLKAAFSRIKPVCDLVMVCPTPESITAFTTKVSELKKEVVQELQQYLLFPFITHIKSAEIENKYDLQCYMVDAIKIVLERVTVNNYEMCMKIETGLLNLVFDNSKPGMIADVPEELKHSVMKALTVLMLSVDKKYREKLLKTQVPMLAQAIFVAVHIAKLEKLRALRLAAINCVTAHTATHPLLTNSKYRLTDAVLERTVVDMLASILPGVLAALQDVAVCNNNPGHAVIVASLDAIHRILCLTMHDKYFKKKPEVTVADITKLIKEKANLANSENKEVSSKDTKPSMTKRSPEWYKMASDKLVLITKSLASLQGHDHVKVRKELAVYCSRILKECIETMQPSIPIVLDILITLCKDDYPTVAEFCTRAVNSYMNESPEATKMRTLDGLCDNFFTILDSLPSILNNVVTSNSNNAQPRLSLSNIGYENRKLAALNLLHGYVQTLSHRVTTALSSRSGLQRLCEALTAAAALNTDLRLLTQHATRDVTAEPASGTPWLRLRLLSTAGERRLQALCAALAVVDCAQLLLDALLGQLQTERSCELVCVMNWMAAAENSPVSLVKRILDTYIQEEMWYLPLEVTSHEAPISKEETLDVTVFNPRAWEKDSVPGLYEGTTETRYTDISYQYERAPPAGSVTVATAQHNMLLSCLLTEGVGSIARRLMEHYQPYLLKTLCLILERVGSKYEMLHLAGLKAINDIAFACGHDTVAELIRCNADYFTNQVTARLKKAWNSQSALQILSVVMEYCDVSMLDCLYGIVEDVLVQSCDKYYEKNLHDYLQVFVKFMECIRKWYPIEEANKTDSIIESKEIDIDIFSDLNEYIKYKEESEKLMSNEEFEKESGKSVEEMYKEDLKNKEDNVLDYDDRVTEEKPPVPQHIKVTIAVLKRCIHFINSRDRDEAILALQVLILGLPVLQQHEDELLPLVHQTWAPLVTRFESAQPSVMRRALDLFLIMAELSKDFILSRAVKEVLPNIYKFLHKSSSESHLKDKGSAYRNSQAYSLQLAALTALPRLAVDLRLEDDHLSQAMASVDIYLTKKQPKPLQALAVIFFKTFLDHDYGSVWHHLRKLCNNDQVLNPPTTGHIVLEPVVGTPFEPTNKDYKANIKLIFNQVIS